MWSAKRKFAVTHLQDGAIVKKHECSVTDRGVLRVQPSLEFAIVTHRIQQCSA